MLVLISMHFSWWFQIWSWNSTILTIFTTFVYLFNLSSALACRVESIKIDVLMCPEKEIVIIIVFRFDVTLEASHLGNTGLLLDQSAYVFKELWRYPINPNKVKWINKPSNTTLHIHVRCQSRKSSYPICISN